MAVLDNAIWLTGPDGTAQNGSTVISDGAHATTVTGSFTAKAWDASQSGYAVSGFGAFGVSVPITADYRFSNVVENLSFDLQHVNSSGSTYDDMFTIRAYDAGGNMLAAADVIAGLSGLVDETVMVNPDGSVSIEGDGPIANDVTVTLPGQISRLEVTFQDGPDGGLSGGAGIGDLRFSVVPPDDIVEGTGGDDLIDANYTGDPEGDRIDAGDSTGAQTGNAGSDDDYVLAGGGNDTVDAGAGDDAVYGEGGDDSLLGDVGNDTLIGGIGADTLRGGIGDDSLQGGAGDDDLYGDEDDDTILGGAGDDTIDGGLGADLIAGGDGADSISGNDGDDTIKGGAGDDWLRGSVGNDEMWGGEGDDYIWSGYDDDTIRIENNFGNDTISAEGIGEVSGDVLDLSLVTDDLTIDLTGSDPEAGTFSDGVSTASFEEIENIVLGGGRDTIKLADLSGADRVIGFDMTDAGDGSTRDQLDVSQVTSDYGTTPVTASDVIVTDTNGDGSGDAILTFPNGESITLVGVTPDQVDSIAELNAIGIPCFTPGTLITTASGQVAVEDIAAGDLVQTVDNGLQPVIWARHQHLRPEDLARDPGLRPVIIRRLAFGNQRRMRVSPQHGLVWAAAGGRLIRAKHAAEYLGSAAARLDMACRDVTYIHLMFERHQLIYAEGAPAEAFYPGPMALKSLDVDTICDLMAVMPAMARLIFEAASAEAVYGPPARPYLKARDIRALLQRVA